ncbi:ABC transporter ATP-binding protein [Acidilutibacter cellobiosedens]|jgi:ABC-2 type transport system ATP-binding protein|uniref:ABC transporter ATP-binding protein n=1 Tax=Acidilutibacter cellobiosedens TaxID=2507161 RepID=A0A410QET6_9FIRM|nr:ABC transporter ATP-binding protein [Acidilutibacter cellobiosedens]MBE6082819.1 ABC transporter ATP-binding protein [Tissierellaceae bacterium]QAT62348.1 ABC transporter ATP-binding protein [Acidilutibacter cellobiosedens]
MLKISNISKEFGKNNKKVQALNHINLQVDKGEIVCILGHNGAGKTTLIKCISGLIIPTSGEITIDSESVIKNSNIPKNKVGAVLEGSRNIYYYLTPRENLKYFGLLNNLSKREIEERTEYYLNLFDLKNRENDMVKQFSRGMQQKVAIMVALMKEPDILLLDEPTLGLDIISSSIVKNIIKELSEKSNKTIMITTHDVRLIENLDSRVVFMKEGRLVKDDYLSNLKNIIGQEDTYELVITEQSFKRQMNELIETDYQVIDNRENLIIINTTSKKWIAQNIDSLDIININKKEYDFEAIYRRILEEGAINEKP